MRNKKCLLIADLKPISHAAAPARRLLKTGDRLLLFLKNFFYVHEKFRCLLDA